MSVSAIEPDFVESLYYLADNSKRNYLSRIKKFKLWCYTKNRVEDQKAVVKFAMTYKSTYSQNQVLAALKRYLRYKHESIDIIKPVRILEKIKPYLNEEQLHLLLKTRMNTTKDLRNSLMFRFLSYGGVRVSELVEIKLEDVDLTKKSVRIHGIHVKGNKHRTVYVDQNTITLLKDHVSRENLVGSSVLFNLTTSVVRRILKRYLKKADLPLEISPHRLRDSFAIRFMGKGGDITKLSRIMGHSKISTTMGYLKYNDKELQNEYEKVLG